MNEPERQRAEYFSFHQRQSSFDDAMNELIIKLADNAREKILPSRNALRYQHGTTSISTNSNYSTEETGFIKHETVVQTKFADITDRNIQALPAFLEQIVEGMHRQFAQFMYSYLSEVCDKSGQTISGKGVPPAQAFLQALRSMEFGIDAGGKVSKPAFHAGSEAMQALFADIEKQGAAFEEEFAQIIQEKEENALRREENRKTRYRTQT